MANDKPRSEIAPDMMSTEGRIARQTGAVSPEMPKMLMFRALIDRVKKEPNSILTPAVQANPRLLAIVKPFMAGEKPLESIAPQLAQEIIRASGKEPDVAVGEWLSRFAPVASGNKGQ